MKRVITFVLVTAFAAAFTVPDLFAQRGQCQGNNSYSMNYNVNSVETVTGEVTGVDYMTGKKSWCKGVHLNLKTENGAMPVHLGPAWFIEQQDDFKKGDRLTITGSRITFDGKPAIIAAKVKRGDMVLTLRDERGMPVWRGWNRMGRRMNN